MSNKRKLRGAPVRDSVVVAYPYATEVAARFMHSLLMLCMRDAGTSRHLAGFQANSSGANVTNARNEIVAAFLDGDADWLWFVDTDMVFEPDTLDRLLAAADPTERPIVGALCYSWQRGGVAAPTLYVLREDGRVGRMLDYPRDQLVEVDASGTGCLLIHRTVLEAIRDAGKWSPAYRWFQETAVGDLPVGEDITFCIRARSLGYRVFVDTSVKVGHEKTFVVDEGVFTAQQFAGQGEQPTVDEPVYVVIPVKDRHAMTNTLLAQLDGYERIFVFDNGSTWALVPSVEADVIGAGDLSLTEMWNAGLDLAEKHARENGHAAWSVAVLNNDIEVEPGFLPMLAAGLRAAADNWIAYPNVHGFDIPGGQAIATTTDKLAGQTMSGYAFMVRGEVGLRFDPQFAWWYSDSDIERQVREAGKHTVCVGGVGVRHLEPMQSSKAPERLAQAREDEAKFAAKWGIAADDLWLSQHPEFGQ